MKPWTAGELCAALFLAWLALATVPLPLASLAMQAQEVASVHDTGFWLSDIEAVAVRSVLVRSLILSTGVAVAALPLAYVVARFLPLPLVIGAALVTPAGRAYGVLALGLAPGLCATALALLCGAVPLAALLLALRLRQRPRALLEAAADLGARPLQRFLLVEWPHLRGAVVVAVTLNIIASLGDVTVTSLAGGGKVYGAAMLARDALLHEHAPARAFAVALVIVLLAVALCMHISLELHRREGASGPSRITIAPWPRLTALVALGCILAPTCGLARWAATAGGAESASLLPLLPQTMVVTGAVAGGAILLGVGSAYLLRNRASLLSTTLALLPLVVPPGISGALTLAHARSLDVLPGLALTIIALLPAAVAMVFVLTMLVLRGIPRQRTEVVADLGGGALWQWRAVHRPALTNAALASLALVVCWTVGETDITAFSSGPGGTTLAAGVLIMARTGDVATLGRWLLSLALVPFAALALTTVVSFAKARERRHG